MTSQTTRFQPTPGLRAVIVTALPVEFSAVCEHLEQVDEVEHKKGSIYKRGIFPAQDGCWEVFVVDAGTNNASAAVETERAIREFEPKVALLVGVAGGLKDVALGDVVAASGIYNYESGKEAAEFLSRPKGGESSYLLLQRARAEARTGEWVHRIKGERVIQSPQARIGPIVAGEKVLTSTHGPIYQSIRKQYEHALAVEMEGSGFMDAARANNLHAIVVRGISDPIEGKSKADSDGWQDVASRHASAFAFEMLARLRIARTTSHPTKNDANRGPGTSNRPNAIFLQSLVPALMIAGIGYWALSAFSPRQPNNTLPPISRPIERSPTLPGPPPATGTPSTKRIRPALMGPVRTVAELRALTAVSSSTDTSGATTLQQVPPGQAVFIQPWNISPSAKANSQRTSPNAFEVHRLETGSFVLVGGISQRDAAGLKVGQRIFTLLPVPHPQGESIIGIPFEMIRSTQVQPSAQNSQVVQVELAAP